MRLFKVLFVVSMGISAGAAERLSQRSLHLGKVERVYLGPGLMTIIEFPEAISEVSTGAPQVFKTIISNQHPSELLVQITRSRPFPSNLIVRTVKRIFVFDLIPSLTKHQDVLKVRTGYGSLGDKNEAKVIERGEFR